jgi:hypothetical protein
MLGPMTLSNAGNFLFRSNVTERPSPNKCGLQLHCLPVLLTTGRALYDVTTLNKA